MSRTRVRAPRSAPTGGTRCDPIGRGGPTRENGDRQLSCRSLVPMLQLPRPLLALLVGAALAHPASALTLLTEENPPFNYSENGKLTGLVTELVLETVKRANIPYAVEVLPWNRAYGRTQSERDTCLFATARLDNREKLFVWVGPYASNVWGVYGKGDFAGTVRLLADLKPYRIGAVVNDAKADYLKEGGVTNVKSVVDDRQNPPRLFLPKDDPNRIDLWVTGYYGAHQVARGAKVSDLKLVFVVREIPLYLACSPQTSPTVIKALTEALDKIRAEGLPEKLTAAYEKKFAQ